MKFFKDVEAVLADKLFPLWVYAAGLLAIVTTPSRITDHTHEIEIIGSAWFRGNSIPLVQAYSNFGPLNLFIGAQYDRYITNGFTSRLFELAIFSAIALLLYYWIRLLHPKKIIYQNTLLVFGLLIISIPGIWQVGINPGKLGLLFLIGLYYFYALWEKSGKSFWLFGETARNSRFLFAAGVMLSGLVFSSLLITLFAIPVFIHFGKIVYRDWQYGLRQGLIFFGPTVIQGWIWYSYFASRQLLGEAIRAAGLDFRLTTHGTIFDMATASMLIFPILLLLLFVLLTVRRDNFSADRKSWIIGLGVVVSIALSRGGILLALPLIFLLAAPLQLKKLKPGMVAVWCLVGLAFVLPHRFLDASAAKLAVAQAQIAETYVEQRLIDTNYVLYYGRGAGFFTASNLTGSSRFYNSAIFPFDNDGLDLVDKFRGDNEANTPLFVVYSTEEASRVGDVPRIEEYFERHYDEITALDGYRILRRK